MGMRLANGNWSDALADTPENQAAYGAGSGYQGSAGYGSTQYGVSSGGGGGGGGAAPTVSGGGGGSASQLGQGINSLLGAIASGNKAAFDEAVRQFNTTFGL